MELAKYKACICEGSAEEAIIDILIDNDLLIFNREEKMCIRDRSRSPLLRCSLHIPVWISYRRA